MSDLVDYGYSVERAAKFNAKMADKLGFRDNIPKEALDFEAKLRSDPSSEKFAEGVHDIQVSLFGDEEDWDGKLGRGTWRALLRKYDRVEDGKNYLVFNGRRLMLPEGRDYEVICFDEPGGFDLHREADWQRGRHPKYPLSFCALHWAGGVYRAKTLYNIFENAIFNEDGVIIEDPRNVSSHGGIEMTKDGRVRIYQMIDLWHRTWHGGKLNPRSVGWDILTDPRKKYYERTKGWGWDVDWIKNPSKPRRGDRMIGTMDPRFVRGTRQFIDDMLAVLKLGEVLIPLGKDGLQSTGEPFDGVLDPKVFKNGKLKATVVGHHHATKNKWDVAPFMPQLFPEFYQTAEKHCSK